MILSVIVFVYALTVVESANEFHGIFGNAGNQEQFVGQPLLPQRPSIATAIRNFQNTNALRSRAAKLDQSFKPLLKPIIPTLQRSMLDSPGDHLDLELQNLLFRSRLNDLHMRLANLQNTIPQPPFPAIQAVQFIPVAHPIARIPLPIPETNFDITKPSSSLIDGFLPNLNNPVQLPVDLVGDAHGNFAADERFNDNMHDSSIDMLQSELDDQPFESGDFVGSIQDTIPQTGEDSFNLDNILKDNNGEDGFALRRISNEDENNFSAPENDAPSFPENAQHLQWSLHNFNRASFPQNPPMFRSAEENENSHLIVPSFQPLPDSTSQALEEQGAPQDWLQHFSEQMRIPKPTFFVSEPVWQRSGEDDNRDQINISDIPQFSPLLPNQGISEEPPEAIPEFVALPEEERKFFRYSLPAEALEMQNMPDMHMGRSFDGSADPQFMNENIFESNEHPSDVAMDGPPPPLLNTFNPDIPHNGDDSRNENARAPTFGTLLDTDITIHKTWSHKPWEWDILKPKPIKTEFPSSAQSGWSAPHFPPPSTSTSSSASSGSLVPHGAAASSGSISSFKPPTLPPLRPLSALTINTQDNHVFNNQASHSQQNIQISNADGNSGSISQSQATSNDFFLRSLEKPNEIVGDPRGPSALFAMPFWRFTGTNENSGITNGEHTRKKRELNFPSSRTNDVGYSGPIPLLSLLVDPNVKLDMPKTLENLGVVARNSFEDPNGPLYHVRNTLSSARNVMLSALKIPHHDFIIPANYKIVKHVPNDIVGDINPSLFDSAQGPSARKDLPALSEMPTNPLEGIEPFLNTYLKLGTMLRESIRSAQESLSHVGDVYNSAKKSVHATLMSAPRVLKYAHVPVLKHQSPRLDGPFHDNKVMLIGPKLLGTAGDLNHDPANIHEDFVGVGRIMHALGISNPDTKKLGYHKIVYKEKIPFYQHGLNENPKLELQPRPKIVLFPEPRHYKNRADLKDDMIASSLQTLQNARETVGATSLEDFFSKMKQEWTEAVGDDLQKSISENVHKLSLINNKLEEKLDKIGNSNVNSIDKIEIQPRKPFEPTGGQKPFFKSKVALMPAERLKSIAEENMEKFNALQKTIQARLDAFKSTRTRSVNSDDFYESSVDVNSLNPIKESYDNGITKDTFGKTSQQLYPLRISIPLDPIERDANGNEKSGIIELPSKQSGFFSRSIVKREENFNDRNEFVGTGLGLPESLLKPYMGLVTEEQIEQMDEMGSADDGLSRSAEDDLFVGLKQSQGQSESSNETPRSKLTPEQMRSLIQARSFYETRLSEIELMYHAAKDSAQRKEAVRSMFDLILETITRFEAIYHQNNNEQSASNSPTEGSNSHFTAEQLAALQHQKAALGAKVIAFQAKHQSKDVSNARQAEGDEPHFELNENKPFVPQFSAENPMPSQNNWQQQQIQMEIQRPRIEESIPQSSNFNGQFAPNFNQHETAVFDQQRQQTFANAPFDQGAVPQDQFPQNFNNFQVPNANPNIPTNIQQNEPPQQHIVFRNPAIEAPRIENNFAPNVNPNIHPQFQNQPMQFDEQQFSNTKPQEQLDNRDDKTTQNVEDDLHNADDINHKPETSDEQLPKNDTKPHAHPHPHSAFHIPGIHIPRIHHAQHSSAGLARADALDPFHLFTPLPDLFAPSHAHRASESSSSHHKSKPATSILPFELPKLPALPLLPGSGSRADSGSGSGLNLLPALPDLRDMMAMIPNPDPGHFDGLFRQIAHGDLLPMHLRPFRTHHNSRHSTAAHENVHHSSTQQQQHPSQSEAMQNAPQNPSEIVPSSADSSVDNDRINPKFRRP